MLLTRTRKKGWDIPGGRLGDGEMPVQAVVREMHEETAARVEVVVQLGIEELANFGPKAAESKVPYPFAVQVYYLCRLIELGPFTAGEEVIERRFFKPAEALKFAAIKEYAPFYEEGLRLSQFWAKRY